jgi:thioredoxin-related protein
MFRNIVAFVLFISISVLSQTQKPQEAESILGTAIKQAKLENKNVFVIFHASWCGWCKRLDKAITSDELKKIFENNFIIAHLDVLEREEKIAELENPGGREVMKKFGGEKSGLPFYVFLDSKGNKIADSNVMTENSNIGYPGAPEEIDAFIKIVKKSGKNLTKKNLEKIGKYLTDNAPKPKG